jgi:hypothetical protein
VEDYRSARIAYVLYESNRDTKAQPKPYRLEDFLLFQKPTPPQTPEDMLLVVTALNDIYGGTVTVNE